MNLPLIVFFISLIGIIVIIGRKSLLLKKGRIPEPLQYTEDFFDEDRLEEWKKTIIQTSKYLGHIALVGAIKGYVRSINFLKSRFTAVRTEIKELRRKKSNGIIKEEKEDNKFLKKISEYKRKVREIKHRIKEEEKSS